LLIWSRSFYVPVIRPVPRTALVKPRELSVSGPRHHQRTVKETTTIFVEPQTCDVVVDLKHSGVVKVNSVFQNPRRREGVYLVEDSEVVTSEDPISELEGAGEVGDGILKLEGERELLLPK